MTLPDPYEAEAFRVFTTLSDRLTASLSSLRSKDLLTPADVDETCRQVRRALLDADVAVPVVRSFIATVKDRATSSVVSSALTPAEQVTTIVYEELTTLLGGQQRPLTLAKDGPTVVMLAGLQGAGKTTLAGKLAAHLVSEGRHPLLVAADLQRPNAVTQLRVVAGRAGVPVFAPVEGVQGAASTPGQSAGDPVQVARDGVAHAATNGNDVVIIDTAGRLGADGDAMAEAAAIRAAVNPHEVLFVIDAMTGQDAVTVARAFVDGVGITGVVLSKLDGDTRGGAALSVVHVTGAPVLFASTGEKLTDFEVYHPDRMASRMLDMGDMATLVEKAEKVIDAEQAGDLASRIAAGQDFTLDDFLTQLHGLRQLGSIKKLIGLLPGMGQVREAIENFDERELNRIEAMVRSMTPDERAHPEQISQSRMARIARGSGATTEDVAGLLERFAQAQVQLRAMTANLPLDVLTRAAGNQATHARARKAARSGNPAKRAQGARSSTHH